MLVLIIGSGKPRLEFKRPGVEVILGAKRPENLSKKYIGFGIYKWSYLFLIE